MPFMKNLFLLFCVIITFNEAECGCSCPDGWVVYKDSCYKFIHDGLFYMYSYAQAKCGQFNSYLLEINNQEETDFINSFINSFSSGYVAWLGISDAKNEGQWVYEHGGHNLTYSNWAPGQPGSESGNEDCGLLQNYGSGFRWYDAQCHDHAYVICEKSATKGGLVG